MNPRLNKPLPFNYRGRKMTATSQAAECHQPRRSFLKYAALLGSGALLACLPLSGALAFGRGRFKVTRTRLTMGTFAAITVIGPSRDQADAAIGLAFDEMARAARLFDRHRNDSPIGVLNRDGIVVDPGPEVVALIARALRLNGTTRGAFDITVAPVVDLYQSHFAAHCRPPDDAALRRTLGLVDCAGVQVRPDAVRFARPAMGVTLDGIAKGYVIDCGIGVLQRCGIANALINAGGDVRAIGGRGTAAPWQVAIQNPDKERPVVQTFALSGGAVATSGNYEVYFDREKLYHHLVDPLSARPVAGQASVTVTAPSATVADALSTAVFVAGPQAGPHLIETLPGVECLMVSATGAIRASSGWPRA